LTISSTTATLIAATLAAAASVATLVINSRLTFDRERRQALIKKEIDRMFEAEELAGRVLELSASYAPLESKLERLPKLFEELDETAGRLARYPDVQQALRHLSQSCKILVAAMRRHEDDRPLRTDLNARHTALINAMDAVIRPKGGRVQIVSRAS
jgi:hypothetical protein